MVATPKSAAISVSSNLVPERVVHQLAADERVPMSGELVASLFEAVAKGMEPLHRARFARCSRPEPTERG